MPTKFTKEYEHVASQLGRTNVHAVPRITKVVLNVGVGKRRDDKQYLEAVRRDLAAISGQAPHERVARKAIAGFNVRENNLVGYRVTLRGKRMEDFVQRFVQATLPRVRDFRGLKTVSLDGQGNLSVGLTEHLAFPEIHPDKTDIIFGVESTFVTSAKTNEEAEVLFRSLGFPFRSAEQEEEMADLPAPVRAPKQKAKKVA